MRCLQEICTYYGMEDRCAPEEWQSTITVRNWAAERCPKIVCNMVLRTVCSSGLAEYYHDT